MNIANLVKIIRFFFVKNQREKLKLIRVSPLFDSAWYIGNNPDLINSWLEPAFHYLLFGAEEGRDPGPNFNTKLYYQNNPGLEKSKINPLIHYLSFRKNDSSTVSQRVATERKVQKRILPELIASKKTKIFCVGQNKTGTKSLKKVLQSFEYEVGKEPDAVRLIDDWAIRDFNKIVDYCQTADAFQDVPFSLNYTYQILDYAFPESKFILTIRNNADEWYDSLIRFHSKIIGINRIPTADDLKNFVYLDEGRIWRHAQYIYGINETTLYDPVIYKTYYNNHNNQVMDYFRYRPGDLLVLNLSDSSAMESLCKFLNIDYTGQIMPHLNATRA